MKWIGPWLAALGGALWCSSYISPLIDPFRLDVVLQEDWAQHTLGWLFFRREPLSFPLGRIHGFLYPIGTTLGYMDSIPWLAVVLRFFDRLLPRDFQYLGLWMLACSALLAWSAARVSALSTRHWEQQALAGVLVAMAPNLLQRIVHPALCAQFLLVLAIWLLLEPVHSARAARRTLFAALALLFITSATHPYLACMVLAISIGLPFHLRRQLGSFGALAAGSGMLGLVAGTLYLFGYLGSGVRVDSMGFGEFSANLNTFFNSMGFSRIFPGLPTGWLQYEGYCYLGAGCLFLSLVAAGSLFSPRGRARVAAFPWRRAIWPLIATFALGVFALATPWRWGDSDVLNIRLYRRIARFAGMFRSSGRMIWPLAYFLELCAVTVVLRALRGQRWLASAVLAAAVALQAYDIDITQTRWVRATRARRFDAAKAWSLTDASFKHLVLYPAEIAGPCENPNGYPASEVNALAYLAYRRGWTFNSGYAARVQDGTEQYCWELERKIHAGELRDDTIYVAKRDTKFFRRAGAVCGKINRSIVCVVPKNRPFAEFLAKHHL